MPRTLSGPTSTETAKRHTRPGYLASFGFSFPLYFSSRSDIPFNGHTFIAANLKVGAVSQQPNGNSTVSLTIGNSDRSFGAVCLAEPPQDKLVSVWKFYDGATGSADPILIFSGSIDSVDKLDVDVVTLQCSSLNRRTLFLPRRRINAATGFNQLMPAGRILVFNGLKITVTRDPE